MNKLLLKRPLITEKSTALSAMGKYVFVVDKTLSGPELRKILKAIYKVDVIATNVINAKPKVRRLGRSVGTKPGYKKIIVSLKKGQKLDIMPQ